MILTTTHNILLSFHWICCEWRQIAEFCRIHSYLNGMGNGRHSVHQSKSITMEKGNVIMRDGYGRKMFSNLMFFGLTKWIPSVHPHKPNPQFSVEAWIQLPDLRIKDYCGRQALGNICAKLQRQLRNKNILRIQYKYWLPEYLLCHTPEKGLFVWRNREVFHDSILETAHEEIVFSHLFLPFLT